MEGRRAHTATSRTPFNTITTQVHTQELVQDTGRENMGRQLEGQHQRQSNVQTHTATY
jgi:hypothetical protein